MTGAITSVPSAKMIAEWLGAILELNAELYKSGLGLEFEALGVEVDRKSEVDSSMVSGVEELHHRSLR